MGVLKRAELPDVNINTGVQNINTERASLVSTKTESVPLTLNRCCRYPWKHRHGGVYEDKPKGDEWNKIVELIGPAHHQTQHHNKNIHSSHHLERQTNIYCSVNKSLLEKAWFTISHVTGFSDLVDLWVIKSKKPMILCARSTSRSREQSTKGRSRSEVT